MKLRDFGKSKSYVCKKLQIIVEKRIGIDFIIEVKIFANIFAKFVNTRDF